MATFMEYGGVSVSLSVHLRETYDDIKAVSNLLKYYEHNWILFVDLKMVSFLLGQQRGFTNYPCHLCMWDSRDRENTEYKKSVLSVKLWTQACQTLCKTP